MDKKYIVIFSLLFSPIFLFSQNQLGIRLENYAGINGISLNPTHSLDYPLRWNLNLVGFGFFVDNNYGYISNSTIPSLIRNEKEILFGPNIKTNRPVDAPIADFFKNDRRAYALLNATINGPALSVKLGENHVVGTFFNGRMAISFPAVSPLLRFYYLDSRLLDEKVEFRRFGGAMMAWDEIGLNYAFRKETSIGFLQIGASIKYLRGREAIFAQTNKTMNIARRFQDSIRVIEPDVTYGFTTGNFDIGQNETYNLQTAGTGIGVDLGFSYLIENDEFDDYGLKFSASMMDIGRIRFKNQAEKHNITFSNNKIIDGDLFKNVNTPDEAVKLLSQQALGDSTKTKIDNQFTIGLPTFLCFQADYQFFKGAFANATWIQRLPYERAGVRQSNILALSARYEHRWFSVTLPVQLFEFQRVRMGFAARLACLTVGTDYLGSFVGKGNVTGTDIYFALKVNPTNLGLGRISWFDNWGKRNKKVRCYEF